jgi:DNA polymerase delta subunit 3
LGLTSRSVILHTIHLLQLMDCAKVGHTGKSAIAKTVKANAATSSKMKPPSADTKIEKILDKPKSSEKGKAPEKAKADEKKKGTLDWSKAKTKVEKEKETVAAKKEKEVIKESKASPKEKASGSKANVKKESDGSNAKVKKEFEESKAKARKEAAEKPKVSLVNRRYPR